MTLRTVIVDDEELARRGIRARLRGFPDVDVVAECASRRQAVDAIRRFGPDLVFLDVQLADATGFDVIEEIGAEAFPNVIFVTAHDQYAIEAFRVNALDYLLKPVDQERFDLAFNRMRHAAAAESQQNFIRRLSGALETFQRPSPSTMNDRILVKSPGRVVFVKVSEIDWVESAGDYVTLHVAKKTWLLRVTISGIERQLAGKGFFRIHRSLIVNAERIVEMRALDNGEYRVILRGGDELKLSRSYRHNLPALFGNQEFRNKER